MNVLRCWFFNTRCGDAILFALPSGEAVLIDGGSVEDGAQILRHVAGQGIDALAAVVLSHPDIDHYGGLTHVFRSLNVARFYSSGARSWTPAYRTFIRAVASSQCNIHEVRRGDHIPLKDSTTFKVLWPPPNVRLRVFSRHSTNSYSVVLKVQFGDVSFLLPGDLKRDAESEIVAADGAALAANVLKIPHHGSRSSASEAFLRSVGPTVCVLTGERGNWEIGALGHAAPSTLDRILKIRCRIVNTCTSGTVMIESNGLQISIMENGTNQPSEGDVQ